MEKKKPGRPFVYQSDDEKPVTVSLRLPRDVYEQARRYVGMRPPMTLTDLLLDGLRLRLETPADPRDIILSDDNTVIQELQGMIQAAVQAEIGKLRDVMGPHVSTPACIPTSEAPAQPIPALSHDGNAVIQQEQAKRKPGRQPLLRQPIVDLLRAHPEGLSAEEMRVHLKVGDKKIGDTLQGMVRHHVIEKRGSGKAVRYVAGGAQPQNTTQRRQAKRPG